MSAEFSVLLSVYKGDDPDFFSQAVASIFNQTLPPTEIVLVADGPLTPQLYDVLDRYSSAHPNFKVVTLDQNSGLGKALGTGILKCTYDLIARMDSDDIAMPDRFERQINYLLDHPTTVVVGGHIEEFLHSPGDLNKQKKVPIVYEDVKSFARLRNPLNHPTVMFRKQAILAVGSYKDMPLFEDYYLWLRLLTNGYRIENIDANLLYFRVANMHKRRNGIQYFKKEIHFFNTLKQEGLITNPQLMLILATRLPFRVLPTKILSVIYNQFLREGGFISRLLQKL